MSQEGLSKRVAPKDNFTIIDNRTFEYGLSIESVGLLCWILSKPPDWVFYKSHIGKVFNMGKDKINRIYDELRDKGFMYEADMIRAEDGTFTGKAYLFYSTPQSNHCGKSAMEEKPSTVKPLTDNPPLISTNSSNTNNTNTLDVEQLILNKGKSSARHRKVPAPVDLEQFNAFYAQYPRKEGRLKAEEAWGRLTDAERLMALQTVSLYALTVVGKEKGFIAHPTTWLNQKRFNDEYEQPKVTYKFPNGFKPPETTNANEFFGT